MTNIIELMNKILEKDEFACNRTSNYPKLLSEFTAKTIENIDLIKTNVPLLEVNFQNSTALNNIFYALNNIKRSSGFIGQNTIQKITYQTERLINACHNGSISANKDIITSIYTSIEYIRRICYDTALNSDENFSNTVFAYLINLETIINKEDAKPGQSINNKNCLDEKINNELLHEFKLEIENDLKTIENEISKLDKNPDKEILNSVFCAVHTITGVAEQSGYALIHRIASQIKILLEDCQEDKITINSNVINLFKLSRAYISNICDNFALTRDESFLNDLYNHLENMHVVDDSKEIIVDKEYWQDFIAETNEHLENIEMNVLILERDTQNIQLINTMYRSFHTIKGLAGFVNQHLVQEIAHKTETIMTDCLKGFITVNSDIVDLILSSADCIRQICSDITLNRNYSFLKTINAHLKLLENIELKAVKSESDSAIVTEKEEPTKKIGEIFVDQNTLSKQDVETILKKQKDEYSGLSFGQIVLKEHKAKPREILNAIRKQQIQKAVMTQDEFMRVPVNKIDNLVDLIGEMIKTEYLIEHESANFVSSDLFQDNITKLSKISKDIEKLSIFLRIMPLKSTFQKITRIARDTMTDLNKDINFIIQGEDIEIDRNIAEKILVPLVHLVRNAISHGIEDKEEREKTNKTPQGRVIVSTLYKNEKFYIKVSDDGRGIDVNKIYKKALEQDLVDTAKDYSEKEIMDFIFLPGFSSAEAVNKISGRGFGLDIVDAELQKIDGKIDIINKIGEGCTFILEIPVKNIVMNGIIVEIKGSNYFIPSTNIRQIIQPQEQDWDNEKSMIRIEGELIPLIILSGSEIQDHKNDCELIILLEIDQEFRALPIKKIIERQKIEMSMLKNEKILIIPDIENSFVQEK